MPSLRLYDDKLNNGVTFSNVNPFFPVLRGRSRQ
jgi:hypothetical protein